MAESEMYKNATISSDQRFRYRLERRWIDREGAEKELVFCMLNPSTADHREDDATIRKCIGFAKKWGYEGFTVVNLCAFRATKPADLLSERDPRGQYNFDAIDSAVTNAKFVVAAWGGNADKKWLKEHARIVLRRIKSYRVVCYCLGKTRSGQPRHPLMLSYKTELEMI